MRILLVDHDEKNISFLDPLLSGAGYAVTKAAGAEAALSALQGGEADLVLMAAVMPGLSGFEAVSRIKSTRPVPVILLTGAREQEDILLGLKCGADEFLPQPFIPEEVLLKVRNILKYRRSEETAGAAAGDRSGQLREILRRSMELNRELAARLLATAEYKDDESGRHILRVGKYSRIIAENLGLKGEFLDLIEGAAPLHDLGKIGIPDRMLLKAGKLTPKEFEIVKTHTVIGAGILEGSEFPLISMAHDIALTHHEKWDGTGYPSGKKGGNIPLSGRIAALADVFDALTSQRPYKPPYSLDKALIIIREGKGKHFDPDVTEAFFATFFEIETVYKKFRDQDLASSGDNTTGLDSLR
ncbi:MAG: HD domain-containing phosphohydrolase [Endomicrobiales bacterium]